MWYSLCGFATERRCLGTWCWGEGASGDSLASLCTLLNINIHASYHHSIFSNNICIRFCWVTLNNIESFEPKERMDCQKNSPTTKRAKKAKELNLLITLFSEPTKMWHSSVSELECFVKNIVNTMLSESIKHFRTIFFSKPMQCSSHQAAFSDISIYRECIDCIR